MKVKQIISDAVLVAIAIFIAILIFAMMAMTVSAQSRRPDAPGAANWRRTQYQQQYNVRSTNYRSNQYRRGGRQ